MISLRLNNYWQMIFQLLLSVLIKWSPTSRQILLQFRTGSSPPEPKQQQQQQPNKTKQQTYQEDIEELKTVAVNKNTSRLTKQWMKVFNSWCSSRHLDINIETMAPEELDNVLGKFYAELKKKDGEDYEPESLKIMQSSIERYLRKKIIQ